MHIGLADLHWQGHHTLYVNYLARYFVSKDHEVRFITDNDHERLDELPELESFEIITHEFSQTPRIQEENILSSIYEQWCRTRQLRQIFGIAEDYDLDVLHLLYFDRTQVPLYFTTRLRSSSSLPIVATLHRDAFINTKDGMGKSFTLRATRHALSTTLSDGSLSCLTVHADSIRDRIINNVPGATMENTRTFPAPTPSLSTEVSREAAREYLNLPVDEPIALFFGGLREEKGPDLLADALQGLDKPLTAVFAGPKDDFTEGDVDEWAKRVEPPMQIVNRVEFVPESDVDYYFVAADVLVLPYRRKRGISGPLRRACAAETPVIGNAESDIGTIIERNDLGWTFTDDSPSSLRATLSVFLDEYETYPTEGLQRYAEEHHWTKTGETIMSVYEDVCDQRSRDCGQQD